MSQLTILTNIPTPYRLSFFSAINAELATGGDSLTVFFCADTERNRLWRVSLNDQPFRCEILPGLHVSIKGIPLHFNPRVVRRLRSQRPRWLISAGAWNLPTVMLANVKWVCPSSARVFWTEAHESAVLHAQGPIAAVRRASMASYDGFAVPNQRSEDFVRREVGGEPAIIRLPNTANPEVFYPPTEQQRAGARDALGLPMDSTVICTVSQLEPRKRVLELTAAFLELTKRSNARPMLVVAGTGSLAPQMRELMRQSQGSMRMLGHLSEREVRGLYHASDGFALLSSWDPNPLSMVEAAMCGLPIVAAQSVGNAEEIVDHERSGLVLESSDPRVVLRGLEWLAEMGESDRRLAGSRSACIARSRFSQRHVASNLIAELKGRWP